MERRVTDLEQLPERMSALESQIVQFRAEVRDEFSAVRQEMTVLGQTLRAEMEDLGKSLRAEMADLGRSLRGEIADLGQALRVEMTDLRHWAAEQDDETRRFMRVLHEEVLARLTIIRDGQASNRKPRRKNR